MTAKPIVAVKALSHTTIRVADLDRSVDFYQKLYGYDVFIDNRAAPGGTTVLGLIGDHTVELIKQDAPEGAKAPRDVLGHACIAFSVEDIDVTHATLKANGYVRSEGPETFGDVRVIFVRDPDGTLLEFIELPRKMASLAELAHRIRAKAARENA